jgi:hypothetical protein
MLEHLDAGGDTRDLDRGRYQTFDYVSFLTCHVEGGPCKRLIYGDKEDIRFRAADWLNRSLCMKKRSNGWRVRRYEIVRA